jgi:hypothetical protein
MASKTYVKIDYEALLTLKSLAYSMKTCLTGLESRLNTELETVTTVCELADQTLERVNKAIDEAHDDNGPD